MSRHEYNTMPPDPHGHSYFCSDNTSVRHELSTSTPLGVSIPAKSIANSAGPCNAAPTSEYAYACVGAPLCKTDKASHSVSGNMSGRVLLHCPHLMKAVPPNAIDWVNAPNHTYRISALQDNIRQMQGTRFFIVSQPCDLGAHSHGTKV